MKTFAAVVAIIALIPSALALTVATPADVVQCQPIQFSWSAGTPPYYLSLIPYEQLTSPPLKTFPEQTGLTYTWLVDLQANTNLNIALKDATGMTVYSSLVTIEASSDSSCLNTTVAEGTSSPASTSGNGTSSTATGTSTGTSKGGSTGTSTGSTGSQTGSAARGSSVNTLGIAGLMGLVGAALF